MKKYVVLRAEVRRNPIWFPLRNWLELFAKIALIVFICEADYQFEVNRIAWSHSIYQKRVEGAMLVKIKFP
jgi:hypothetical protein